jgi:nucleotide-binding universal stress UspA family protein
MYKNILLPISSDLINVKIMSQINTFVKDNQAAIVLNYVSEPLAPNFYSDSTMNYYVSEDDHKKACEIYATKLFDQAKKLLDPGISVNTHHIFSANVATGILKAAEKVHADLIVMASHKRTGIKGFILGSDSHDVILHSHLPVLVLGD